jgi:hypothetical protein
MRSLTNHVVKLPGIDTLIPEPVDITTLGPPGQNVCQVRLACTGAGVETALAGHVAAGTLLMLILAVKPPVVVMETVGLPVTTGLVKANAVWLMISDDPAAAVPPAASRLSA